MGSALTITGGVHGQVQFAKRPGAVAREIFAFSLFPYLGFLYHLTSSKQTPRLALIGFYFLLVFVGVSIPAGIIAKVQYGTSLSNVDWLHGGAEVLLTITNLMIVLGFRRGIVQAQDMKLQQQQAGEAEAASGTTAQSGEVSEG